MQTASQAGHDMSEDITGKAATALAAAFARAVCDFEAASTGTEVRTRLPHPFSNLSRADWVKSISLWRKHGAPLLASVPRRDCPTCSESLSDYIFDSYDAYPYHECAKCRTWFVPLDVNHDLFERYFEIVPEARRYGDYTDSQAVDPAAQDSDRIRFEGYYAALKACLARADGAEPATLDVGCGVANSLAVAAGIGFAAEGIEVNRHAVALARKLNRRVHFPGELPVSEEFDAVTMWETLEHIADPLTTLRDAHARLKRDGLLAVTVPNLNAPDIRSMRGDSLQIHGGPAWPGHINLWTPETLSALLRRAGFEPVHLSGQFSSNLEELAAYHLGQWSGARDYLRVDTPEFVLPATARDLVSAIGAAAIAWQEGFAFAPILFVLARRADGVAPPGLETFAADKSSARQSTLSRSYSLAVEAPLRRVRGTAIDLSRSEWSSDAASPDVGRLHLNASASAAFGYLWRSPALNLPAGSRINIRGMLYSGSLSIGLLQGDHWNDQMAVTMSGQFETFLMAPDGDVSLVFSNNDNGCGSADATIDCAEIIAAESGLP